MLGDAADFLQAGDLGYRLRFIETGNKLKILVVSVIKPCLRELGFYTHRFMPTLRGVVCVFLKQPTLRAFLHIYNQ